MNVSLFFNFNKFWQFRYYLGKKFVGKLRNHHWDGKKMKSKHKKHDWWLGSSPLVSFDSFLCLGMLWLSYGRLQGITVFKTLNGRYFQACHLCIFWIYFCLSYTLFFYLVVTWKFTSKHSSISLFETKVVPPFLSKHWT